MKEWYTRILYIQRSMRSGTETGCSELTNELNRLEREGWTIEGVECTANEYHVLLIATREITARDVREKLRR